MIKQGGGQHQFCNFEDRFNNYCMRTCNDLGMGEMLGLLFYTSNCLTLSYILTNYASDICTIFLFSSKVMSFSNSCVYMR